jgi:alpha-ketoglutarate-dependent taurine dioxygenase
MNSKSVKGRSLGSIQRKAVSDSQQDWVKVEPLLPDKHIPLLVTPNVDGVNLIEWADHNRPYIQSLLIQHRALLFRGFDINTVERFEAFVEASSDGKLLEYVDRTTPRHSEGGKSDRVYISTIYPAEHSINPHNEGTYWTQWAQKLYFCCLAAPEQGGETPIFDVHNVYKRLNPAITQRFAEKKWMLVRNYNEGFGLPWQEVFQVRSRAELEAYCESHAIRYEWIGDEHLRTYSVRQAIHHHPLTGDPLWFNHAAFYHYTTLDPSMRALLLEEFGQEGLPYNTWYGDGTPIEPEVIEAIRQAYLAEKVKYRWQVGDAALLDNMYIAHAREPYTGSRRVVVAMTEPTSATP